MAVRSLIRPSTLILLITLVSCCGCFTPSSHSPPVHTNEVPTPPYSDLSDHQLQLCNEPPTVYHASTIEEILTAIGKLEARSSRSSYRSHLEMLAERLFQKLATSHEIDTILMTLLATSSCHHPLSKTISRELIRSDNPIIQLTAVQVLSSLNSVDADYILTEALRSDYPVVRLEAGWRIASKRSHDAFFHIDALSYKLPSIFLPYMPELFAIEGSSGSVRRLRQLLFDPCEEVVIETLIAVGRHAITGLGPEIAALQSHSPAVLEAQAFALRSCDSEASLTTLRKLAAHETPCVRIQAAQSLTNLGEIGYQSILYELAKEGNPFAVAALGNCPEPVNTSQLTSCERAFRINLALSQLSQKDVRCVEGIQAILSLSDDQVLLSSSSIGHSLSYWDIAALGAFDRAIQQTLQEQSLLAKETFLIQALELEEPLFHDVATTIFSEERIDLYPCLLQLLENQQSASAIHLLEREANRVGAPYNRTFATLALVRLGIERDEETLAAILDFSRKQEERPWRLPLPWINVPNNEEKTGSQHAAAAAQLYITTIQTLAERGTPASREILVQELQKAPQKYLPFVVAALLQATM